MDIDLCISELQQSTENEYEEPLPVFEKYRELLLSESRDNPKNIRAVCLLAMVCFELREDTKDVLKYLKHAYKAYKDELSDDEYAMLVTDIAYLYIKELRYSGKAICNLLKSAAQRNPTFPETYYALAMVLYDNKKYSEALPQFKRACGLSDKFRYHYNYADCLFRCGYSGEAIEILRKLSLNWHDGWRGTKAYFLLGYIYANQGHKEETKKIAVNLFSADYDDLEFDGLMFLSELAGLMFLIGDFEKCAELFENDNLAFEAWWMGRYFYCLKESNQENKAKSKLLEAIEYIEDDISDKREEASEWEPKQLEEYIVGSNRENGEIQTAYDDAFTRDMKPDGEFVVQLVDEYSYDGCYYIECPRHYRKGT